MDITSLFSAFGLSASAGLNAYLPLLIVGLTARYTDIITLGKPWDILENPWVLLTVGVLLIVEMTADKIPAVDSMNDIIQTVGRPTAGAVLFAANSGVIGDMSPVVACIAGLLVAGTVHGVKATARPIITGSTMGAGNWAVSLAEDILALIGTILAILLPMLFMMIFVALFMLVVMWWGRQKFKATT